MKLKTLFPAVALVSWICTGAESRADITINYDFLTNSAVPDGSGQLSIVQTLGGLSQLSSVSNVATRLNLTTGTADDPMYLGDLYASLTFGTSSETQRIAVLLNRPGVNNSNGFGSSLNSLNVTVDDSSATNIWATTSSNGTYKADGRLGVDPYAAAVAFANGSNGLAALNGTTLASNRVSLLIADTSEGGKATLSGWGISVTGVAASSGSFAPGANGSISDAGADATNAVGATLDTTGAAAGGLLVNLAGTTTFSNGVTGTGGLLKTGTGKLVLEGTSNFTGTTTINNGILAVNGTLGSGSAVTVNHGGALGGSGTVSGSVTVKSGGVVGPGNSPDILTTGAGTFEAGSIFSWDLASNLDHDADLPEDVTTGTRGTDYDGLTASSLSVAEGAIFRVVLGGSANLANGFWTQNQSWDNIFSVTGLVTQANVGSLFDTVKIYNGLTEITDTVTNGSFSFSGTTLSWTAVPEPTSALAGLLITAGLMRRRRSERV